MQFGGLALQADSISSSVFGSSSAKTTSPDANNFVEEWDDAALLPDPTLPDKKARGHAKPLHTPMSSDTNGEGVVEQTRLKRARGI